MKHRMVNVSGLASGIRKIKEKEHIVIYSQSQYKTRDGEYKNLGEPVDFVLEVPEKHDAWAWIAGKVTDQEGKESGWKGVRVFVEGNLDVHFSSGEYNGKRKITAWGRLAPWNKLTSTYPGRQGGSSEPATDEDLPF